MEFPHAPCPNTALLSGVGESFTGFELHRADSSRVGIKAKDCVEIECIACGDPTPGSLVVCSSCLEPSTPNGWS